MKKRLHLLTLLALMAIGISAGTFSTLISNTQEVQASVGNYTTNPETYYDGITATSGTQLLGQIHDLITTTHHKYTTYDDNKVPDYIYATDGNPNNSNAIIEFYTQYDIAKSWAGGVTGTWNREHVWPQSLSNGMWGESNGGADMHHIRPTESTINSTRGNALFGVVATHNSSTLKYSRDIEKNDLAPGGWLSGGVFEPLDFVKGDVARIIMYVYTHYNTYVNVGGTTNGSGGSFGTLPITNVISGSTSSAWELLLDWNGFDPVDAKEIRRNNQVATYQGNRNPFIDNEDFADAIWGDEPLENDSIVTNLTINPTSKSYTTDNTLQASDFTISVTKNSSSGTSADYTAKIGTGTGGGFSGRDIIWGTTKPLITDNHIQIKAKYPTSIGGEIYLSAEVALTVTNPPAKSLSSISVSGTPTKTVYTAGETFNSVGITVTAHFDDSSTSNVTGQSAFAPSPLTQGTTSVTVSYTYGDVTKTTSIGGLTVNATTVLNGDADLFFSEYLEGNSYNKAIEIYNPTPLSIDLSNYQIRLFTNGSTTAGSTLTLSGTLLAFRTYVVKHTSASASIPSNLTSGGVTNFNGDDALVLYNTDKNEVIDSFGKVGEDPGNAWTSGAVTTLNKTLVRKALITRGDDVENDTFDPSLEWDVYSIDTFSYVGDAANGGAVLAEYLLEDNTINQCLTKYPIAKNDYFLKLSSASKTFFQESTDANLIAARARYNAWALNHGDSTPFDESQPFSYVSLAKDDNQLVVLLLVACLLGITITIGCLSFKRKRKDAK